MATLAHRLYQNFKYWIEQITPTSTYGNPKNRFFFVDTLRTELDETSGLTRGFSLQWLGSNEDANPTDLFDRWAEHNYQLEVGYSTKLKTETLHKLVAQDRHDLCKQLRSPTYLLGWDVNNTTTDIGLDDRVRIGDELDTSSPALWILRQQYRCLLQETED